MQACGIERFLVDMAKVLSVSPVTVQRLQSLRSSHWALPGDTAWPLGSEAVTGPASMIQICKFQIMLVYLEKYLSL